MLEALLSGGMKLLGGWMGQQSQEKANEASLLNAAQNRQDQMDTLRHGIEWRVEDAKRAGIHPLYALGASPMSFAPVSVGLSGANPMASALGDMGQDISRAVSAYRGAPSRVAAVQTAQQTASNSLDLENKKLNNEILKARLAALTQPGTPPGIFTVGEGKKEDNPPLMIGGTRVADDPGWSPTKSVSDRWGDESIATNTYGNVRALRDMHRTYLAPALAAYESWASRNLDSSRWFSGSVSPRRDRPRGYY